VCAYVHAVTNLIVHVQLAESEAVRIAHCRGMQSLAALCLAYGPGIATAPGLPANTDLQVQLQWLIGIDQVCTSVPQLTSIILQACIYILIFCI